LAAIESLFSTELLVYCFEPMTYPLLPEKEFEPPPIGICVKSWVESAENTSKRNADGRR